MENRLIWDNDEQTVLRQLYTGKVTTETVLTIASKTYDLLNTVSHTVHLIIDSSNATSTHQSFVKAARQLDNRVAPNQGLVVVIDPSFTSDLTVKSMKLVARASTRNVHTVKTLDEARAYIAKYQTEHSSQ